MTESLESWNAPNRMLFGWGAVSELGSYITELGAEHPFLVTDEGVLAAGVLDPIDESLSAAGLDYEVWSGVRPDPTDEVVHAAADAYAAAGSDLIVGVGGGSSMDTAKAASILATNDGHILEFAGSGNVPTPTPPSVYVPTTAGTGSEVGHWAVVTDSDTAIKEEIGDPHLLADLAVVDPELTASAPAPVKAATGMDVLTHAVEAYVSIKAQSPTSALALDSIEKVGAHLPRAVEYRGEDREALTKMARASMQAGMAFNGAGLGAVHALSHQVGATFGVPHGLVNAIILPYVMEYNLPQVPDLMVDVAAALGEDVDRAKPADVEGRKAVAAVRRLGDAVRIPGTLAETDAERAATSRLAEQALDDGSLTGNPRTTDAADLERILERAFDGELAHVDD
ncbi:iron-containing alcohol dehydrogenase family protein [Halobellus ruber]|uniref:Iron-containing alcohol dehydrogenase n=1 Tax=Halobellus ruber TaxID=2761102 RepID=A0A7J9SKA4_9EURY|nr:iron-containing alcohol dehydrogenase [Halobellus ruber]MBB6646456.1 iron-containing alcohol dehydrogenase [Halobellus ruber]